MPDARCPIAARHDSRANGRNHLPTHLGMLFDCDGTLIDTMPFFFLSWQEVCADFGLTISEEEFYSFAGMTLPDIVRSLHRAQRGKEASEDEVAAFLKAKHEAAHRNGVSRGHPAAIECVVSIARDAVRRLPVPCPMERGHLITQVRHGPVLAFTTQLVPQTVLHMPHGKSRNCNWGTPPLALGVV